MMIMGHRGAAALEPENTLLSVSRAIDIGVDAVEIDVHQSRDQEIVVIHDDTVDRTTNGSGRVSDLTLNLMSRELLRGGKHIELQPREFSLLEYLMRHDGNVVSKTMIMEHVWDYHFDPGTNVVDVLIHRL